jgi:hypothetical protein
MFASQAEPQRPKRPSDGFIPNPNETGSPIRGGCQQVKKSVLNVFWTCQSELGAQVNRKKDPDKDEEAFKDKKRKNQKSFSGPALEPDG